MKNKQIYNTEEEKIKIKNRLSKIEGQVNGIKRMIDQDRYCDEILIQLSAIDKAIKGLSNTILEDYMHNNINDELCNGNKEVIDEIISLFKRFQ